MITESCMMTLQPNENDVVVIPQNIPAMDVEDYDLMDDKDREKYITDLERHIRGSYEYRTMVQYLREYMNMNTCAFLPNISNELNRKIRIELHHSPFTLRDICVTIFNKRSRNLESLTIESVAYEVMYVHYSLMVGLIPLSETVHELVHNQYIFIPTNKVYGYYKQFAKTYYDYIDPELLDRLDELEKLTKEGTYNEAYKQVLEKKYVTVSMDGYDTFAELHNLQDMLKDRLASLRNDNVQPPNQAYQNPALLHPENLQ